MFGDTTLIYIYLWSNAALYVIFSVWCLLKLDDTSTSLGYITLSEGGRSEYAVVYCALQFGLGLFFAYTAVPSNGVARAGLMLALVLYGPIVVLRWITVAHFHVTSPVTLGTGALETALLAFGLFAWWRGA